MNEYYGAPTTPASDYLAHYGVKGMKWGVRKALAKGGYKGEKALARRYKKDIKHLAKLQKRAASGKKYAKRAAALGAGAALAGGAAALGTGGVSNVVGAGGQLFSKGTKAAGEFMQKHGISGGGFVSGLSKHNATGIAKNIRDWGGSHSIGNAIGDKVAGEYGKAVSRGINRVIKYEKEGNTRALEAAKQHNAMLSRHFGTVHEAQKGARNISNSGYARLAAAGVGAGLAAGAGYNAYRALTAKRNAERADTFRKEMNKAYAGTKYANGYRPKKKRRG